jgi:DNA mismatch repair protein MutL
MQKDPSRRFPPHGGRIIALPPEIVNKIAAGEVIERPASIVKELVENSLDAGAERISVEIEEGGVKRVRVTDDGEGIWPEDLGPALCSHATSKLSGIDDLFHIETLGFRGEALSSIASVAEVVIRSRLPGADEGAEVRARGGEPGEVKAAGLPVGTRVEVRDLFYNTPARRKFLKSPSVEARHVAEAVRRIALARPDVDFTLAHGGRRIFALHPAADLRVRIMDLYGRDVAEELMPVAARSAGVELEGHISPPHKSRRDTTMQYFLLNGRYVRSREVLGAIKNAYHGFLMSGRHPIAFLYLTLDPAVVDVNVHPTKLEVRFQRPREVFQLLRSAIRGVLEKTAPPIALQGESGKRNDRAPAGVGEEIQRYFILGEGRKKAGVRAPEIASGPGEARNAPWAGPMGERRFYGTGHRLQIHDTYIIEETEEGFAVIDQHALHERILFAKLMGRLKSGTLESQRLLVPLVADVDPIRLALFRSAGNLWRELGLEIEEFGSTSLIIRAVPALLGEQDWPGLVSDLLDGIDEVGAAPCRESVIEELAKRMACRSAIKAGQRLSSSEIEDLLADREGVPRCHLCPHGRPTTIRFPIAELEKKFKR